VSLPLSFSLALRVMLASTVPVRFVPAAFAVSVAVLAVRIAAILRTALLPAAAAALTAGPAAG